MDNKLEVTNSADRNNSKTGWESVASLADEFGENKNEEIMNEEFLIDLNTQNKLDNIIDFLKDRDGAGSIINDIKSDIASGKYRDARVSMEDGSIKVGDDAEKERLAECYAVRDIPDEITKLHEKEDRLADGVGKFLGETVAMYRAATFGYGGDHTTGDVYADDEDIMGQLSGRINRNIVEGVYDGAKIEHDGKFNPGVFWSEEACHVYQRRAKLEHLKAEKENPEIFSKFNQEYSKLQEKNPEVFNALSDLSERLMIIAGNDSEAYAAIDIMQGLVTNGMYEDAYVDNQGCISRNNPEEILDNHVDELTDTKEKILEVYNKKSSDLDDNEAKTIISSPLAFKYLRKPSSDQKDVINLIRRDESFMINNWETVKWMLGDDYKDVKTELGIK